MSSFERYAALHDREENAGPGDRRPTALQIVKDNDLLDKWSDKVVLITGCSSGIGIETAKAMKATGAKVYVTARDLNKGQKVLSEILEPARCELLPLKLDSLKSVRECAADFQARESKLNVLINNAGVMALPERVLTEDGFEAQIGTNHFGHFLLFQLLKPQLLAASTPEFHSRVVSLSSIGHRVGGVNLDDINYSQVENYSPWAAYGNSKTANIWFATEIERRFGNGNSEAMTSGKVIHGHSLHPGGIATGLQVHVDMDELMKRPEINKHMKNAEQGAATTMWAAVAKEWEGSGGKYLEDCQISRPVDPDKMDMRSGGGYAPWAYDEAGEKKLWDMSNEMVGFEEEK